jgi:membrane protease YdiL (CAAX protease family)
VARSLRRVAAFYVPCFLLTHAIVAVFLARGGSFRRLDAFGLLNVGMCVPALVAAAVARWVYREPVREALGLRFRFSRWLLFAWLLPAAVVLGALGLGLLAPGAAFSPDLAGLSEHFDLSPAQLALAQRAVGPLAPPWTLLLQGLVLGPTLSAVAGLGEEAAWRGLLHRELQSFGFWRESLCVGLLWGAWHVPLAFEGYGYPHHPWLGAALLLGATQLLSPLYLFVRERSQTVLGPAILHGSFSALSLLALAPVRNGDELWVGLFGVAGLGAIGLTDLLLVLLCLIAPALRPTARPERR